MTRPRWRFVAVAVALGLTAANAEGVPPDSPVAARAFRDPRLDVPQRLDPVAEPPSALGGAIAFFDPRAGRIVSLVVSEPLVPGDGVGNALRWSDRGGQPADDPALKDAVWRAVLSYLTEHEGVLRVDPGELSAPRIGVFEHGALIQVFAPRVIAGIPVRDSGVTAILSHGNLVLLGLQNWGDAPPARAPRVAVADARLVVAQHVLPYFADGGEKEPHLEYLPLAEGDGYDFRLAWAVGVSFKEDVGTWEGLVDAESGALLAFEDRNQYAARRAMGGVYPVSNDQRPPDGIEQPGWPMPFVNVTTPAGVVTTNAAGTIGCAAGTVSTALVGRYVRLNDGCGAINETSAAGDLDLGFGPTPAATDCVVPAGHSAGDTKAARSTYYELTRFNEQARGWLPGNTWLGAPLLVKTNFTLTCNAIWNGSSLLFYRDISPACRNTGEVAGLFDHEWAHGLDNNGVNPTIASPAEAIADVHSALRLDTSCIARGLFATVCSGYGDACIGTPATGCTGRRDIDFAQHRCNRPHTVTWAQNGFTSAECGGSGSAPACPVGSGTPCGRLNHCESLIASETVWDLQARDLRAAPFNLDANTALELTTRLAFLGAQALTAWNTCAVGGGCGATSGYMLFLAADDDDGNIGNGTPHATAIRAAFQRHEIHCATPPAVNSGCSGGPSTAPVLTAVGQDQGATLTWSAVAGASRYYVYRTEGVNGPDFGKIKIADVTETSFVAADLMNGRPYYFNVLPVGANTSCLGPMSNTGGVIPSGGENLAVRPGTVVVSLGDGDAFLDNCETATVGFTVENVGGVALTNVRLVGVTFLTHATSVLHTTLPAVIAPTLGTCATAGGSFAFTLQGATFGDTAQVRVDVTADQFGSQVRSQVIQIGGLETDGSSVASRTYDFDSSLSGWTVTSGTFNREAPGANGTPFRLHSSALTGGRCDLVRSPVLVLTATSTLSMHNRYAIEAPSPIPYDRANVGIVALDSGARTTIVPTGGRAYDVPPGSPNGSCVTSGEAGWAGSQASFAPSTWNAGAVNPGGAFTNKRVQIEVAYGTDVNNSDDGFHFDEVTVTNFFDLGTDALPNTCGGGAIVPLSIAVDTARNAVLEPNESVVLAPTWLNGFINPSHLTGVTAAFTGPAGPVYSNLDSAADYGTLPMFGSGSCTATGNCYSVRADTATRPATHWDSTIVETVTGAFSPKTWTLHVGASFTDVPPSNGFYRFVETILHKNVTGGCTVTTYCPANPTTRDQMAVFVLVSKEAVGFTPPPCGATPMFTDVPASSPFCRWIEELARRGVVSGCAAGLYCPSAPATREQMAVFVLRTLDPAVNPPACGTPVFADVPASSSFCRWIEELARRGVVTGCGGGNYCPTADVTREQMAVFLTATFGLTLYGL